MGYGRPHSHVTCMLFFSFTHSARLLGFFLSTFSRTHICIFSLWLASSAWLAAVRPYLTGRLAGLENRYKCTWRHQPYIQVSAVIKAPAIGQSFSKITRISYHTYTAAHLIFLKYSTSYEFTSFLKSVIVNLPKFSKHSLMQMST